MMFAKRGGRPHFHCLNFGGVHGPKDKFEDLITPLDPCSIGFPTTGTKGASRLGLNGVPGTL